MRFITNKNLERPNELFWHLFGPNLILGYFGSSHIFSPLFKFPKCHAHQLWTCFCVCCSTSSAKIHKDFFSHVVLMRRHLEIGADWISKPHSQTGFSGATIIRSLLVLKGMDLSEDHSYPCIDSFIYHFPHWISCSIHSLPVICVSLGNLMSKWGRIRINFLITISRKLAESQLSWWPQEDYYDVFWERRPPKSTSQGTPRALTTLYRTFYTTGVETELFSPQHSKLIPAIIPSSQNRIIFNLKKKKYIQAETFTSIPFPPPIWSLVRWNNSYLQALTSFTSFNQSF